MRAVQNRSRRFLTAAAFVLLTGCSQGIPNPEHLPEFLFFYGAAFADLCGPLASPLSVIQPASRTRLQFYMQYQALRGSYGSASTRLLGTAFNGAAKWEGGAMAPNGKIYGARYGSLPFLEIDPETSTAVLVGPAGNTGSGMVLLPSGSLLEIPHTGTAINPVVFNPNTGTTATLSGTNLGIACAGGVLAPNGKVYCTDQSGTGGVLEINPDTGATAVFGTAQIATSYGGGMVLGLNGKVYAIPFTGIAQVAEIDPVTQSIVLFGPALTNLNYFGAVLSPSGKIYAIPFNGTTIQEIDPDARTVTPVGSFPGAGNYLTGILAPNGRIYLIPRNSSTALEFDPVTRTTTAFGTGWGAGFTAFDGGILGMNGKIYGFPLTGSGNLQQVIEIDPKSGGSYCPVVASSAYFNKF